MLRFKFERLRRELRQEDVTDATGIPQTDVSAIERGRVNPTPAELDALSRLFDIAPEDLLKPVDLPDVTMAPSTQMETAREAR